jgi:DNA-directed RNA polymerase subunit beta'
MQNIDSNLNHTFTQKKRSFVFLNQVITKKDLEELLGWMFRNYGLRKTCMLTELLKEAGFNYATQGGLSISIEDLKVPGTKSVLVNSTNKELEKKQILYERGELTSSEWFQKQVTAWNLTSEVLKNEIIDFFERTDPLNPLYMMTFSGARGNLSQVRQLIGMRGLMSDQKGEMIGSAIQKNFREGLSVIDFLISSYGARKGLVDTAIRTADSGYMTRRLVDIAQDVVIRQFDCQSRYGILFIRQKPYEKLISKTNFEQRLLGRILAKPILNPSTKKLIAHMGQEIDFTLLKKIKENNIQIVSVRSPLTCQSYRSVCQICFGWDLVQHRLIEIGEAIGIIAAQSIGEPGTQLTMRTFHTGGVFSRELSQQVRSNYSGQVKFGKTLKTNFVRTVQGDYAQIIRNTSFFDITTYKNEVIRIKVDKDDLLLIKNGEFVKKGQPIVQSASQFEEADTEVQKTLTTKFPGEIYYQPRQKYNFFEYNMIIWVLAGNLLVLPFESKKIIRSIDDNKKLFAKTKLVIKSNSFTENIMVLKTNNIALISKFYKLNEIQIFKSRVTLPKINFIYLLQTKENRVLILRKDFRSNINENDNSTSYIGRYLNQSYRLNASGTIYNLSFSKTFSNLYINKNLAGLEVHKGGCITWIQEQFYPCYKNQSIALNQDGLFVKNGNWIFSEIFSPFNGLISQKKQGKKYTHLIVRTGIIFVFQKAKIHNLKFWKDLNGRFFFPGEILFEKILIQKILYGQVYINSSTIRLILRPVSVYTIPKSKTYMPIGNKSLLLGQELIIKERYILRVRFGDSFLATGLNGKNLVESTLLLNNLNISSKKNLSIIANFNKSKSKQWSLYFGRSYQTNKFKLTPRRLKVQDIYAINYVRRNQILEPYTILGCFYVDGDLKGNIIDSRSQYSKRYQSQELLIVTNNNIRKLYLDEQQIDPIKKDFLFAGDKVSDNLILNLGGKISSLKGSQLTFRIGIPYLFTEGAKVYKNHKDFAPENTVLGFVTYRIFKTQDIIQGLPKVEEILEARGSSDTALLADKSGIVTKIVTHPKGRSNQIELLSNIKQLRTIRGVSYTIDEIEKENLEVESYQYINIANRIHKGFIDPQQLLDVYFEYFKQRNSHQKATFCSLYKLASIFIKSIQGVYENQGIKILDRHLEVIVRQMLIKAKIEYPGSTPLVIGEYLDVHQLVILNKMLHKKRKNLVYYKPSILGLTKAALTTESFISAASFQESIRILTQAAIEGRVDWLRGLKEKVILGGLIPCGTGIVTFLDEWVAKNVFLYGRSIVSRNTRRKILRKKSKIEAINQDMFVTNEITNDALKIETIKQSNSMLRNRIKNIRNK